MKTTLHLICFALFFASCSQSSDVVSKRFIQKRKYQKGFFVQKLNGKSHLKQDVVFKEQPQKDLNFPQKLIGQENESLSINQSVVPEGKNSNVSDLASTKSGSRFS